MPVIEPSRGVHRLIDRTTATEAATRALREIILNAEIPVGAPLRQDDLARQLGVSRTPLREALQRLEAEGLVRLDIHKGAVVAKPSIAQVSDIFELQEVLETIAGRGAIERTTDTDIEAIRSLLAKHAVIDEPAEWGRANTEFHTRLYSISGKPLLVEMIGLLRNRSGLYVHMLARSPEGRRRADQEHQQMLEALTAGDADGLETLIRHHLRTTLEWLKGVIEE